MRIDMTFSCGLLFLVAGPARVRQRRDYSAWSPEFSLRSASHPTESHLPFLRAPVPASLANALSCLTAGGQGNRLASNADKEKPPMRLVLLALLLALAGCNANRAGPEITIPPQPTSIRVTPPGAESARLRRRHRQLPHPAGCRSGPNRVGQGVYDEIKGELTEADQACAEGDNLRALGLLRASKAKHGYAGWAPGSGLRRLPAP